METYIDILAKAIDAVSKENFCGDGIEYDSRLFAKAVLTTLATNLDDEALGKAYFYAGKEIKRLVKETVSEKKASLTAPILAGIAIQSYLNAIKEGK